MQTKKQVTKDATWMERFARASFGVHIMSFAAGTSLIALLILAYYVTTWRSFANFQAAIDTCTQPFCDFVKFYYPMGEAVFHTKLPLNGFVYSPFIAILMALFPPFGLHTALALWSILLAISIIFYLLFFRWLVPAGLPTQLLFVGLALSSFPLLHTLTWGQVSMFTTTAVLGALFFYERGQRTAAAILLAFGLSFKFFPIIFLVPFVFRRDIRFLLYMTAACATFLLVIPSILLGVGDTLNFYRGLIDAYGNFDWVITNYNSQYFPHVFIRLAKGPGMNTRTYLTLLCWIAYGIAAINMGLVYLVQRACLQHTNLWSFHIIFLTIPFVLFTSWPVDLVYVSFAQGLLAWYLLEERNSSARSLRQYMALVLLFASIFISNIFFFNLVDDHIRYGYIGFIFWANLLLLVISHMELLPLALRKIREMAVSFRES